MKKTLSIILTVALMLTVLPFGLFGLTASADEAPKINIVDIGDESYVIDANKTYAAYDSIAAAIEGLEAAATYADAPEVTFEGQVWDIKSAQLWKHDLLNPKYIAVTTDYNQLCFFGSEPGFARKSVVLYNGGIYANAAHGWQNADDEQIRPIYFNFTANEDGKVVVYDAKGNVKAGANVSPFWGWTSASKGEWATFEIYKNDTLLWPLNGEDNKFDASNEVIKFPDLGAIDVVEGDVISVVVTAYGDRTGLFIDPVVSYTVPVEETTITIDGNDYVINANENYAAYDEFKAIVNGVEAGTVVNFANSKWNLGYKYVNDRDYNGSPWSGKIDFVYRNPYNATNGNTVDYMGIQMNTYLSYNTWSNCFFNSSATFIDEGEKLYISPNAACLQGEIPDSTRWDPTMKFSFTAYRDGAVVLYDETGKISGVGANQAPFYANEYDTAWVDIEIYKNDTLIWPVNGEVARISKANTNITFPDLGNIYVQKGDEISILFKGNPEKPDVRSAVFAAPAIAYAVIEEAPEATGSINIGGINYPIYADKVYTAYDSYVNAVKDLEAGTEYEVTGSGANWEDRKYTGPVVSFNEWSISTTGWVNGDPLYLAPDSRYTQIALYPINPGLAARSVAIFRDKLFVNPSHPWDGNSTKTPLEITFTATETGKVVLYDTEGKVYAPTGKDLPPFYNWTTNGAQTSFTILKNGAVIWPLNGEDNTIEAAGEEIAFPDLGAIAVNAGDKITIAVSSTRDRAGIYMSPAIAYVYSKTTMETVVANGKTYDVVPKDNSNAYAALNELVADAELGSTVSFGASKWALQYKFYDAKGYNVGSYKNNAKLTFVYRTPYHATSGATVDYVGIQVQEDHLYNTWNNCFFSGAATFIEDGQKLYISPSMIHDGGDVSYPEFQPAIKLVYTVSKTGTVVLYDTTGKFSGVGANQSPFYANENDNAKIDIKIYLNDEVIWPAEGETAVITKANTEVAFPNLGELKVTKGDTISIEFNGSTTHPCTRSGLFCNPGVTYVHEHEYLNEHDELCVSCGAARAVEHDYDNDCDADCNTCGVVREALHVYADCVDTTCENCEAERVAPGHTVWADCDDNCDVCGGYVETTADHVYTPECSRYCFNCLEDRGGAQHKYDNECDATCEHCGSTRVVPDHVYDNECDADCNVCGVPREVGEHVYTNGHTCDYCGIDAETVVHIDEDKDGVCDECFEEVEVEEHVCDYKAEVTKPDCVNGGYTTYTCECGESYVDDYTDALGHTMTGWHTEVAAKPGVAGLEVNECSVCGADREEREIAAIATPYFNKLTVTLESNISLNLRVEENYITELGYEKIYFVCNFMDKEYILEDYTIVDNKYMQFPFNKVAANMMIEDIEIKLYGVYDGEVVEGRVLTYSVLSYLKSQLKNANNNQKTKTLVVDLLNYGAYAQIYSDHKTDKLPNAELTEEQKAMATPYRNPVNIADGKYVVHDSPEANWNTAALVLDASIVVKYKFTAVNMEGITVQIKVGSKTYEINTFDAAGNNQYFVSFDALHSAQLSEPIYATVMRDGVAVSNTMRYSVESFIYAKVNNASTDAKIVNLVKAMISYGDAAYAFTH